MLLVISAAVTLDGTVVWVRSGIQFASFTIAALVTGWLSSSARAPRITAALAVSCAIPVWGALQLMFGTSVHNFATRNAILDSATFAVLFFIAVQTFENAIVTQWFIETLFVFAFLAGLVVLASPIPQLVDGSHYCVFVELLLPIGLYCSITARDKRLRYLWAAMSATLIVSAMITGSRAGCALIAAEVVAVPLAARLKRHTASMPIAFTLVLVAIFAAGMGWRPLVSRFDSGGPHGRGELVAFAVDMARDRPLTGFGLGSFESLYPVRMLIDDGVHVNHAHNDWAEWAATGGLPLLAMYITIFGLTLPLIVRSVWAIGVAAMCLHALVDFPFEIPALLVLNAILMGAASAAQEPANTSAAMRKVLA